MALASKVDELITLPADQKTAKLIAVFGTDELEITSDDLAQVAEHGDVYDLLESDIARSTAQFADAITLVTCGWASPIAEGQSDDEQVAPSQHPERRRVRLVVTATREHTASVLQLCHRGVVINHCFQLLLLQPVFQPIHLLLLI
jgi:hypothetical protein